jgi:hypothetical protein
LDAVHAGGFGRDGILRRCSRNPDRLHRSYEYGVYAKIDIWSKVSGYSQHDGFYFTTVPARAGYLVDRQGLATSTGLIQISNKDVTIPLKGISTAAPYAYKNNSYTSPAWATNYTLTGGGDGVAVAATVKWYRR